MMDNYYKTYGNMWSEVDNRIKKLIVSHTKEGDNLLEVGFGSGHFLASISDQNRFMTGVEIRQEAFEKTKHKLLAHYPEIILIQGSVLEINGKYDLVYSTGLIQCLEPKERKNFLRHNALLADKVIYTVPRIVKDRNLHSNIPVGVEGCEEYDTGSISYELSESYSYVEMGTWPKEKINLKDDFIWFYCDGSRILGAEL